MQGIVWKILKARYQAGFISWACTTTFSTTHDQVYGCVLSARRSENPYLPTSPRPQQSASRGVVRVTCAEPSLNQHWRRSQLGGGLENKDALFMWLKLYHCEQLFENFLHTSTELSNVFESVYQLHLTWKNIVTLWDKISDSPDSE